MPITPVLKFTKIWQTICKILTKELNSYPKNVALYTMYNMCRPTVQRTSDAIEPELGMTILA